MGSRRTTYAFLILLCVLVVVIPLPFAGMRFFWRHVFEALIFFGCASLLALEFFGRVEFSNHANSAWRRRAELAFVLFLVWNAVSLIPVSRGVFSSLFAHRAAVKALDLTSGSLASGVNFGFWEGERELLVWTCSFLLFFMTTRLAVSRRAIWTLILAVALSATFQALYGIYEYASGHQHILGVAKKYYTTVATGTFICRNHFAAYLLISLAVVWAGSVYLWRRSGLNDRARSLVLALWSVFAGAAIVASGARGEILGCIVAVVGFHLILGKRADERLRPYYLVLLLTAGVVLMLLWVGWEPLVMRMSEAGLTESGGRPIAWIAALKMVREFGLFGVGLGSFGELYLRYRPAGSGLAFDHAHNDYLELFAECGLFGFAILTAAVVFAVLYWFDRFRDRRSRFARTIGLASGMAAVGLAIDALVNFPFRNPAVLWHFAVVLGIGASALERKRLAADGSGRPADGKAFRLFAVLLMVALGLNSVRLAWGQRLLDRYGSIQQSSQDVAAPEEFGVREGILEGALGLVPEDFRLRYEMAKLLHRDAAVGSGGGKSYRAAIDYYRGALGVASHRCRARLWGAMALMQCRGKGWCGAPCGDEDRWFAAVLDCCPSCARMSLGGLEYALARRDYALARTLIGRSIADSTSAVSDIVGLLWSRLPSVRAEKLVLEAVPVDSVVYELFARELFERNRLLSADRFWREARVVDGVEDRELSLFGVVRNGGFEEPMAVDPFGWKLSSRESVDVERASDGCREGAYCLRLKFSGSVKDYRQLTQDIALCAGLYEIAAWLRVEDAARDEDLGLELIELHRPDRPVVRLVADPATEGWQRVRATFAVRDSTARLRLRARRIAPEVAGGSVLWLDDIRIVEVEP